MPLKLIGLILPLSLDTLAVSLALGVAGVSARDRLRLSLLFAAFEAGMPVIGVAAGALVSGALGDIAEFVAVAVLALVGLWMIRQDEDELSHDIVGRSRGIAAIGLGLSISLDELVIGFTIGLLGLPLVPVLVLIAAQAVIATQIGTRFGQRLGKLSFRGEQLTEHAEQAAGALLVGLAVLLLGLRISGHSI